jgi:hypothetical protein
MPALTRRSFVVLAALAGARAAAQPGDPNTMTTRHATGPFDVTLAPLELSPVAAPSGLGRMSLDKRFHGALEATSQGEMLAFRTPDRQSGGYVAMETVRGTLDGRRGSFVLQHSSTMLHGAPSQSITVAPGSGTGELAGLTGRMVVEIAADGAHAYRFDYELPGA